MTVTLFKALADETRIRLLRILLHHELSVNELVTILNMGQSRISRHLRILTEADLLTSRRDGLWVFYQSQREGDGASFLEAVKPYLEDIPQAKMDSEATARLLEEKNVHTRQFFDSIAENWDDLNKEILGDYDLPATVLRAVPERCALAVDLGCGTGTVLERLYSVSEGVVGVDVTQRMLELCEKRLPRKGIDSGRISLRLGGLEHLPLRDREADFASINLVLHHIEKPEDALRETRRILKDNGRLFIADFAKHTDEDMRTLYGDRWLGFEIHELSIMLRKAGFRHTICDKVKVGRGLQLMLISTTADPSCTF